MNKKQVLGASEPVLNERNPLTKLKRSNPMIKWKEMAGVCGLTIQTLISIAKMDEKDIERLPIKTAKKLRLLEVDLLDEEQWGLNNN